MADRSPNEVSTRHTASRRRGLRAQRTPRPTGGRPTSSGATRVVCRARRGRGRACSRPRCQSSCGGSAAHPATTGWATSWRPAMVTEAGVGAPGRSEPARRPHACQVGSRTPSWPRRAIHTPPQDCGRGFRQLVPGPAHACPATAALLLASQRTTSRGTRPTRSAAIRPDPGVVTRPQPGIRRCGRWSLSVRRGVASVTCRRRMRSCRAFRDQSTAATAMPTTVTWLRDQSTAATAMPSLRRSGPTHRPLRRPTDRHGRR
jgi:hypothetical protein